CQKYITSPLTF
nr:immunoglobulin light chain junction region [Macaca mulatta]MOV75468.1 immunoglobulin light chain junction region [Macaca mulatta]MOW08813.1 immunoglobulin light chain junction region [Macaca mulatta]MOW09329.1 immunoglobulin light chain junction region [Macaca mulatta]MOW09452.1 immunoglobulin light chain junction region [Macaca mulatta]